ncbi:hypothetical protein [Limnobacter sp. MED105]|uniref:hypothetical protein n=1 Tax=Limnobacter sp. MED105 TaxID=391597 RepID=UPI0012EAB423|nr:hypothetical protein [Limnobacter sp. MED105]
MGAKPTGLSKASDSGLMLLAWGMRNAKASSHRLLSESPRAAKPPGSLAKPASRFCTQASPVPYIAHRKSPAPLPARSGGNTLAAPIKKTCPFEFTRHSRPKAGTETRPAFLPSEVSQGEFQKGKDRFSGARGYAPEQAS